MQRLYYRTQLNIIGNESPLDIEETEKVQELLEESQKELSESKDKNYYRSNKKSRN